MWHLLPGDTLQQRVGGEWLRLVNATRDAVLVRVVDAEQVEVELRASDDPFPEEVDR